MSDATGGKEWVQVRNHPQPTSENFSVNSETFKLISQVLVWWVEAHMKTVKKKKTNKTKPPAD